MSVTLVVGALIAAFGTPVAASAAVRPHSGAVLWVSTTGKAVNSGQSCATAKYYSIEEAIQASSGGDRILVCAGTYSHETIVLDKDVSVLAAEVGAGVSLPVVNALNKDNGIEIIADGASVEGLKFENATGEGILALTVQNVSITGNTVEGNDRGTSTSTYRECQAQGGVPGDCGEGIHLMTVSTSLVLDNTVEGNSGGILVSDEFGATFGNLIDGNTVDDNVFDCGITVVGHNANAVSKTGQPQPGEAGVFENTIENNTVDGNGTSGDGGGILLAAAFPGAASYDNFINDNSVSGNGLAGITIHKHFAGQDLSGDSVHDNSIGTNDLDGDPGTGDASTTGILLDNGGTKQPITITITHNRIANDDFGIYDDTGGGLSQSNNTFVNVTTDVKT